MANRVDAKCTSKANFCRLESIIKKELAIYHVVRGVGQVASEATERAKKILALQEADQKLIRARMGQRAASALALLDHLMERPIITSRSAAAAIHRTQPTVDKLLLDLVKLKLLRETTGQQWGRRFAYVRYLAMFEITRE